MVRDVREEGAVFASLGWSLIDLRFSKMEGFIESIYRDRERETERDRDRERQTEREGERHRERDTHTQRHRDIERQRIRISWTDIIKGTLKIPS